MNTEKKNKKPLWVLCLRKKGTILPVSCWLIYYPFPDRNCKLQQIGPLNALGTQSAYSREFPFTPSCLVNWYNLPLFWIPMLSLHLLRHLVHFASHEELLLVYVSNLLYKTKITSYSNLYLLAGKEQVFCLPHTIIGDTQ